MRTARCGATWRPFSQLAARAGAFDRAQLTMRPLPAMTSPLSKTRIGTARWPLSRSTSARSLAYECHVQGLRRPPLTRLISYACAASSSAFAARSARMSERRRGAAGELFQGARVENHQKSLRAKVQNLLGWRKTLRHVRPVGVLDVIAEPHIKRLLRGRKRPHRRLHVVRFDQHHHHVAIGCALKPYRLALDSCSPARRLVFSATLSIRDGGHGLEIGLGLPRK